jgi:hypothetical protein
VKRHGRIRGQGQQEEFLQAARTFNPARCLHCLALRVRVSAHLAIEAAYSAQPHQLQLAALRGMRHAGTADAWRTVYMRTASCRRGGGESEGRSSG